MGVRASNSPTSRTPCEPRAHSSCEPRANPVQTLKAQIADLRAYVDTLKGQLAAAAARDSERLTDLAFEPGDRRL
jgi:hypothetical protein